MLEQTIADQNEQIAFEKLRVKSMEKYQALARFQIVKETQVESETWGEQMDKVAHLPDIEAELSEM